MYPKTYTYCVDYRSPNATHASGVLGGDVNLEKAKAAMFHDMQYYLAIDGYKIVKVCLQEHCATCNGNGEIFVPYKRQANRYYARGKNVRCPDCKGKGIAIDLISL